jgi:hypothetical protein
VVPRGPVCFKNTGCRIRIANFWSNFIIFKIIPPIFEKQTVHGGVIFVFVDADVDVEAGASSRLLNI